MRLVAILICSAPLWGLSNAVTVQEKSGATQTNRVVTIPRFFADKEVCQNPRPYSGGSAVSYWQADVKSRWPGDSACTGGYAKFALITVELTITGNGATAVEFRSDASSSSCGQRAYEGGDVGLRRRRGRIVLGREDYGRGGGAVRIGVRPDDDRQRPLPGSGKRSAANVGAGAGRSGCGERRDHALDQLRFPMRGQLHGSL